MESTPQRVSFAINGNRQSGCDQQPAYSPVNCHRVHLRWPASVNFIDRPRHAAAAGGRISSLLALRPAARAIVSTDQTVRLSPPAPHRPYAPYDDVRHADHAASALRYAAAYSPAGQPAECRAHFIHIATGPLRPGQPGGGATYLPVAPAERNMQTTAILHTIIDPLAGTSHRPEDNATECRNPHP